MREVAVAIPGDLATPTGGYVYARRLLAALPETGWQPRLITLPDAFPFPDDAALKVTGAAFAQLPPGTITLVDGLAFGALPSALLTAHRLTYVALVHHPLAMETGLTPDVAERLRVSEREALRHAARVVSTSHHTADRLKADYGVPAVTVARPGTDPAQRASGCTPPLLLCVATITPRKGHLDLVRALGPLRSLAWQAAFVGSEARDPATVQAVRAAIAAEGLSDRIVLTGSLEPAAVADFYGKADIFVLPSLYEGYGMVFAEALACGLPIVGCAAGAVPEVVPPEAGLLVPPGDAGALSQSIARLLATPAERVRMADAAWRAAFALPSWRDTARAIADVLSNLANKWNV